MNELEKLKPTGMGSPLAIWRWTGLAAVRAPTAPQLITSAR